MIVLLPNCGFLSETSRMLHIGQALRAEGEAISFATHGGPYADVLRDAGETVTILEPEFNATRCATYLRDMIQLGRPGVRLQSPDEVRKSVAAEAAHFLALNAKAVVTGFTLTGYLSSRVAKIPLVASHGGSFVPPLLERGLVPVPTAMPMPGVEWLPGFIKRAIVNSRLMKLTDPVRFLNDIAAEMGVESVPTLAAMMMGDLTLVTDTEEVLGVSAAEIAAWKPRRPQEYRAGARLVATGPLFARLERPVPPHIEPFLDGTRPTALVVLSSSTPELLRNAVRRVRAAGPRVIVGATIHEFGSNDDPDVLVAGILPNHLVMPRVTLAVTMGGQGSIQTAMASGTPVIGIPLHPEQELNVGLAARHGAGLAFALRQVDTPKLTSAVRRVMADKQFAANAAKVKNWYTGIDGAANAAHAIRTYLRTGTPATRA